MKQDALGLINLELVNPSLISGTKISIIMQHSVEKLYKHQRQMEGN